MPRSLGPCVWGAQWEKLTEIAFFSGVSSFTVSSVEWWWWWGGALHYQGGDWNGLPSNLPRTPYVSETFCVETVRPLSWLKLFLGLLVTTMTWWMLLLVMLTSHSHTANYNTSPMLSSVCYSKRHCFYGTKLFISHSLVMTCAGNSELHMNFNHRWWVRFSLLACG